MDIKFTNNARTNLAADITAGATTLLVSTGEGGLFPTLSGGDYFTCTLVNAAGELEIVKVTARTDDTFTIERAQEGTTAKAFSTNDLVELRLTAGGLENMLNQTFASDAEAIAGTETQKSLTPASGKAAIDAREATGSEVTTGTAQDVFASPKALADAGVGMSSKYQAWDYGQQYTVTALTSTAGAVTWNIQSAPEAKITLSEDTTFNDAQGQAEGMWAVLRITGAGGYTPTFSANYVAASNIELPTSVADGKTVTMLFRSDGSQMELMGKREEA